MPLFTVQFSNRMEMLCEQLIAGMATSLADPLTPEYVLIDNTVMGQWLNLQLAQKRGIAANIRYIQPHELFWMLARALVSKNIPQETPLSKDEMTWKLFGMFGNDDLLAGACMQPVKQYLHGGAANDDNLKRYQLASSVADLFDQYLIYRPEWMAAWPANKPVAIAAEMQTNAAWQSELWRKLAASSSAVLEPGLHHRAVIEEQLLATLNQLDGKAVCESIPLQRLFVFGITSMAPHLMDMLLLLGKHIDVQLYAMNPCKEAWFDIRSARELVKRQARRQLDAEGGDIGNPLLASQGIQVKEFIESLYSRMDQFEFVDEEKYVEPGVDTLLHSVQQEILDLCYQGGIASLRMQNDAAHKLPLPDIELKKNALQSIHIHNCHSPLREMEVLHDQLLAMFSNDPSLKPRDVVVMMPQVAPYVPYIETVFGHTAHQLPYHINDRTWLEEVPLLNTLDWLLALPDSRLPLTDILAMLEVPAVQNKFGLDRHGFEILKNWLKASGARWGLDAAHREREGLPAYSEFSWEFAINRLLAGFSINSMINDGSIKNIEPLELADGALPVLPFDEIEGGNAAVLDSFLQFWERLLFYRGALKKPASALVWVSLLTGMLDDFFAVEAEEEQLALREIRRMIAVLRKSQQWFAGELDLSVIRAVIKPVLQTASSGRHPWREGIKFCSLLPMRGVPFRVVYMLGMNQSDYPKRVVQQSFDLMRSDRRPGDRSRRVDDRWLFLEALLSARDAFHVSYIGRDQRKNEPREPSVVVAELLDYLRHGYCLQDDNKSLLQVLTTEHPLQPFSQEYFLAENQERLLSFNSRSFVIASTRNHIAAEQQAAVTWKESETSDQPIAVSLESFIRFFTDPPRWLFGDCHKTSLKIEDESVSDSEIFELADGLDTWAARDAMRQLAGTLAPGSPETRVLDVLDMLETQWKAAGRWPLGTGGESLRKKLASDIDVSWLDARRQLGEPVVRSGSIALPTQLGELIITGEVQCIDDVLFLHTASTKREKYELGFQIRSAFSGSAVHGVQKALAVFMDKSIEIPKLDERNNQQLLVVLAEMYLRYRENGLPFEPEVSRAYKDEYQTDSGKWQEIIDKAWEGDAYTAGIANELQRVAYYLRKERLLDGAFMEIASSINQAVIAWEAQP